MSRRIRRTRRDLYRAARFLGDVDAATSGSTDRMARRAKNRLVGRLLGRFWRILWR